MYSQLHSPSPEPTQSFLKSQPSRPELRHRLGLQTDCWAAAQGADEMKETESFASFTLPVVVLDGEDVRG